MKLGFARFGASVEQYYRLEMTRGVCFAGFGNQKTLAGTMKQGDLSSRYSRDLSLFSSFIDKNKLFTSAGILASSFAVLFTLDWRMGFFFAIICPALIRMLSEKPGAAHKVNAELDTDILPLRVCGS
jgi:ABC-type multidrug transport system fused ATPase/permease subunit